VLNDFARGFTQLKNICIVTRHPFWREALGNGSLMRSRYDILSRLGDKVFVLFITRTDEECPIRNGVTLKVADRITPRNVDSIKTFVRQNEIGMAYFSYNLFGDLPSQLPCKRVVEIHDVLHLRQEQFQKFGYDAPIKMAKNAELESLKQYDWIVCLNLDEVGYLNRSGLGNVVYLPPTIEFRRIDKVQERGISAGLIGSSAKPNIDGLVSSIEYIRDFPRLIVAGSISHQAILDKVPPQNLERMGVVPDVSMFYSRIDIALSPIRFGAGLKIKAFEALASGKRLIATSHSVSGFPEGIDGVVSVEDDFSRWNVDLLQQTMEIEESRIEDYFRSNFSSSSAENTLRSLF
jgi:glycosyltransferase involved in cell wall biosynthesis